MNIRQEDKLSMYYVVQNTCNRYQSTWMSNAIFAASYNLWAMKMPLIEQNRDAQILETTGITTDKTEKRNSMTEKTLFLINRIQSYATVENNNELLENTKYSATDLKKSRDIDVIGICNTVLAKATANIGVLEAYGVTAEMINELQIAINTYSSMLAMPKVAKSQTKTATQNLSKLFKEAGDLLTKRLDLDIELFKTTNPDFYSQYKTARIVFATRGGKTSVLGSVTQAQSGEPIKGVTFTFVAESNRTEKTASTEHTKPIVKKSADKGKFRATMPENTYRVRVEKIGFQKQEVTITVASGETTYLHVELVKL